MDSAGVSGKLSRQYRRRQANRVGLTTALLLSQDSRYDITLVAKFMPGDYDIEYASPWAGANWFSTSEKGTAAAEWDRNTWSALQDLAKNHPEAGVHFQGMERSSSGHSGLSGGRPWAVTSRQR